MSTILAIDPGTKYLGCAWGPCPGQLEGTGLYVYESLPQIQKFLIDWVAGCGYPVRIVIERPQIRKNSRVRPQDILDLTLVVGACSIWNADHVDHVYPSTWGASGKGTPEARQRTEDRIRKRLSADELTAVRLPGQVTLDHNVWDAVGVWLWASGRYKR